jgi:hypothetical protein
MTPGNGAFQPPMLLSGFMFPSRGLLLKGNQWGDVALEIGALAAFLVAAAGVAMVRYRETLD